MRESSARSSPRSGGTDAWAARDLERKRDESLLSPVVEVALDPPPSRVGGGNDPRARSVELGAALRVCDGARQELREPDQQAFGILDRHRALPLPQRDNHSPEPALQG